MAKMTLRAGAELDLLSPQEHAEQLTRVMTDFQSHMRQVEGDTITRAAGPFSTDASGNTSSLPRGGGDVYKVPVGYDALLTRLSVDFEGSSAASPTTCDIRVVADQNTPAGLRTIFNSVPSVYEASKSHAPLFRGGQSVVVCLTGGPTSTQIYCTVQVVLTKRRPTIFDTLTES